MSNVLYEKAAAENKNPMYYIYEDVGIKKDCKYFVETGTHFGGSVSVALELGFEKVLSCEMMEDRYRHCMEKFKDDDNVFLYLGNSVSSFPYMMKNIDQKSLFWLDAHAEGGGVPTFEELDFIKTLPTRNHSILIDDVPIYFAGEMKKKLKNKLLSINPNYTIVEYQIRDDVGYVMGAYVE